MVPIVPFLESLAIPRALIIPLMEYLGISRKYDLQHRILLGSGTRDPYRDSNKGLLKALGISRDSILQGIP